MAVVNPFADDVDRGRVWEEGYEAGYAEPDLDHLPPLAPDLLDVFLQGEQTGRDDRRNEPSGQDPLPSAETREFSRFEVAPDGILIPIPDEAPEGNPIHDYAQITVNPRGAAGYYVVIFNVFPEAGGEHAEHLLLELMTEPNIALFERLIAGAVRQGFRGVVRFGGLFVGVAISLLSPSHTILRESRFRGYLEDQTAISYVILDPQ